MIDDKINAAVSWAVSIAECPAHGYDQKSRQGPDYDCSSFVSAALIAGGFAGIDPGSTTRTLAPQLRSAGFYEIKTSSTRRAGDILLTPNKHTALCIDADRIVHAVANERGTATGGKTGDQTGREIRVEQYYKSDWKYLFRFPEKSEGKSANVIADEVIAGLWGVGAARKKRLTDAGYNYQAIQQLVNKKLREV